MSEVDKYSELKLVAGKATPGPWWVDSHGMNMTSLPNLEVVFSHPANGDAVRNAETGNLSHWRNDWDASYIATANPKTILELISDFDAQRLRADTAEALSVTNLMLDVVPGSDGMGEEVYAKSLADVQLLISNLYLQAEVAEEKLAAAEQRSADLAATLTGALKLLRGVHTGDLFGPDDWETVNEFLLGADAALNPNPEAESHGRIPD